MTLPKTEKTFSTEARAVVSKELGKDALKTILKGRPRLVEINCEITSYHLLLFWVNNHLCQYYLGTYPPLLMLPEEDKEFTCFEDLINEIKPNPVPN